MRLILSKVILININIKGNINIVKGNHGGQNSVYLRMPIRTYKGIFKGNLKVTVSKGNGHFYQSPESQPEIHCPPVITSQKTHCLCRLYSQVQL